MFIDTFGQATHRTTAGSPVYGTKGLSHDSKTFLLLKEGKR